jgi:glutathione peroxidase-family protein
MTDNAGAANLLELHVEDIDGNPVSLMQYHGQVILIVNVASKCGFTPQYTGLQRLYERYGERGFVILGFPANNFLWQEPGDNDAIKQFCTTTYGVTFPMFAKISVKGRDQSPLYQRLTSDRFNPQHAGDVKWNFTKFLLNRAGQVVDRFGARTKPDDPKLIAAVESALRNPA